MKIAILPLLAVAALLPVALPAQAQVVEINEGTITELPGSSSDYIIFNSSTFSGSASHNVSPYSDLTSFKVSGGVYGVNPSPDSAIKPPGASSAVATGGLQANTPQDGGAFYEMAAGISITGNANFNYNDFDVFVMYSNVDEFWKDTGILLETGTNYSGDPYNGFPANAVPVVDNNTNLTQAYYVEYNVEGLGSYLEGGGYLVLGAETTSAAGSNSNAAYVGAISFESLPEPSTWALMLGGMVMLFPGLRHFPRAVRR